MLNTTLILDMPVFHSQRVFQLGLILLGTIGLSSASHSVHRTLVFVATALAAISAVIIGIRGGTNFL